MLTHTMTPLAGLAGRARKRRFSSKCQRLFDSVSRRPSRVCAGSIDKDGLIGEQGFAAGGSPELVQMPVSLLVERELQAGIEQKGRLAAVFRAYDQEPGQIVARSAA